MLEIKFPLEDIDWNLPDSSMTVSTWGGSSDILSGGDTTEIFNFSSPHWITVEQLNSDVLKIDRPVYGQFVTHKSDVIFSGSADRSIIDDSSFVWSSNIDGILGYNNNISLNNLSIGTHTITLQAKDSNNKDYNTKTILSVFNTIPVRDINIDGLILDWNGIEPVINDPSGDLSDPEGIVYETGCSFVDIRTVYMARNDKFLFLRIDMQGRIADANNLHFRFLFENVNKMIEARTLEDNYHLEYVNIYDTAVPGETGMPLSQAGSGVIRNNHLEIKFPLSEILWSLNHTIISSSTWCGSCTGFCGGDSTISVPIMLEQ
jgi:hypothetical protein